LEGACPKTLAGSFASCKGQDLLCQSRRLVGCVSLSLDPPCAFFLRKTSSGVSTCALGLRIDWWSIETKPAASCCRRRSTCAPLPGPGREACRGENQKH